MELKEIQKEIDEHIKKHGGYWKPLSILARLTEETGELARSINIKYGEKKKKHENDGNDIDEELADVLTTIIAMANSLDIDLESVLRKKTEKDSARNKGVYY